MRAPIVKTQWIALTVALALAAGCEKKIVPEQPGVKHKAGDPVVRVNGQAMRWDDVDRRARNALRDEIAAQKLFVPNDRQEEALQFFRRQVAQIFVNKTLLLAEAKKLGLRATDEDRKTALAQIEPLLKARGFKSFDDFLDRSPLGRKTMLKEFEDGLVVDKFLDQEIRSKIKVVDADRDALVKEISTQRRAAKQKAEEVRQQLAKGTLDFATLMRQNSDNQVAADLGDVTRGRLEKNLEEIAFNLKVNELSHVNELRIGYDIMKVTGHTAAKAAAGAAPATPESVHLVHVLFRAPTPLNAKDLDNAIRARQYDAALKKMLQDLRSKAKIETIYSDLVF
jgi:parvulin-like peptidyl-prolyl isomerase